MKKIIVMLIFMLTACSMGGNEFSQNQKKWSDANIPHYRYELSIGCFCPFRDQMPLKVEVQNGEIVSMINSTGTVVTKTDPSFENFSRYATIDRLFTELDSDSVRKADVVTVKYDSTYGFPTEINIDFIKTAMDDELSLNVSAFEKLP